MDAPLMQSLTEDADSPRAFRRFALNLTVGISLSGDEAPPRGTSTPAKVMGDVTNASMSGLCFSCATEFPIGTHVVIDLVLERQAHRLPAVVCRRTAGKHLGRTYYEYGAQFLRSEAIRTFLPLMAKYFLAQAAAAEPPGR